MAGKCPPLLCPNPPSVGRPAYYSGYAGHLPFGITLGRLLIRLVRGRDRGIALPVRDHWLAEAPTDLPQLVQVRVAETSVTLSHELHRLLEPLILLVRRSLQDTTSMDVAHQFVTGVIQICFLMVTQNPS